MDSLPYWKVDMRRTMFRNGKINRSGGLNRNCCVRCHLCAVGLEGASLIPRPPAGVGNVDQCVAAGCAPRMGRPAAVACSCGGSDGDRRRLGRLRCDDRRPRRPSAQ